MLSEQAKPTTTVDRVELTAARVDGHACPEAATRNILVNGVRVDPHTPMELVERVVGLLACGRSHVVHFLPAHPIVLAQRDPEYRDILNRGAVNLVDGASVAVATLVQGRRSSRTTGSDALEVLPSWGVPDGLRHYLYGGTPDVVARLRRRLETDCPGIAVVGVESPPFRELEDEELWEAALRIREAGTDLLWVGMGTPKQDVVADRLCALRAAPVILCVGAAFDFRAGVTRRAPRWMRSIGMEWLFRLATEPRRLWRRYLIGNTRFAAAVFRDRLQRKRSS